MTGVQTCALPIYAMPSTSVNVAYEAKKKMKKEGVFGDQVAGGPKTYQKDNPV